MKNFVKLIKQIHEERFSVVLHEIITKNIPVAFISIAPIAQAVNNVKNFQTQGLKITKLLIVDSSAIPDNLDFEVINVSDAMKIYNQPEYIFSNNSTASRIAVKNFPTSKVITMGKLTDKIYETFMTNLDELQKVYESLVDEESKRTFRGYWLGNITNRIGDFVFSNTPHYICAGFIPERGAIVIDGGLCDGGTAVRFSQMGYQVYGFEMDKMNYEKACKAGKENNFIVENVALGAYNHKMTYTHMSNPGASRFDPQGKEIAQVIPLDSYVREKNLPRVDFIKLDVEGAELDVLKGASITIAQFKPILALSAYHKWDDFWTIMNFVKSIRPDYEFAMRQFVISREDGGHLFKADTEDTLYNFGLRPALETSGECVLFAR